ncbi:unnamed protein product [Durusdinium trenchii]|uniref:SGNH hydrolase-type esterase domain-containing protein n=1 Tax=Durusdinium trenchii TaxID=1381693 RepID=A0ABP0H9R1_9DINO
MVTVMRVLTEVPRDKGSAIVRFPCDGPGLQVLIYGDSLTAGAPSMKPFGEEFSKSLAEFGCRVEVIACGLCAATAHEMIQVFEEPFVLDSLQCRWGSGLGHLAKEADVVLIMAGTNDLCFADGKQIFDATRGRCLKRWSALPAQRREANSLLASWTRGSVDISVDVTCPRRPLRFINTVALMPFGPQSRLKKYWESDGVHFTETGSKVFGFRLAQLLVAS